MPTETTGHRSESCSIEAPATGKPGVALDRDAKSPHTDPASKPVTPGAQRSTRRRRLLIVTLGVLVLAAALWFGIPYILFSLFCVCLNNRGRSALVPMEHRRSKFCIVLLNTQCEEVPMK
jgi:hypothetical protein